MTEALRPALRVGDDAAAKPILIVSCGRTFAELRETLGDFDDWIANGLGADVAVLRVDARRCEAYPDPATLAGVVISGSHAMVSDREPWSERLGAWLREGVDQGLAVLGICYGHQLLAHALGGQVDHFPAGPEVGTRRIELAPAAAQDLLLQALPAQFPAQLVHYQSALRLPPGAVLLAHSAQEPHQAFRVGERAWGVQFHPEFSDEAMRGYLARMRDQLPDSDALAAAVLPTPEAATVLRRFAVLAGSVPA